jgi:hypothetical protein
MKTRISKHASPLQGALRSTTLLFLFAFTAAIIAITDVKAEGTLYRDYNAYSILAMGINCGRQDARVHATPQLSRGSNTPSILLVMMTAHAVNPTDSKFVGSIPTMLASDQDRYSLIFESGYLYGYNGANTKKASVAAPHHAAVARLRRVTATRPLPAGTARLRKLRRTHVVWRNENIQRKRMAKTYQVSERRAAARQ